MAALTEIDHTVVDEVESNCWLSKIFERMDDDSLRLICEPPKGTYQFKRGDRLWLSHPSLGEMLFVDYVDKVKSGEIGGLNMAALTEIDQAPDQEAQALKGMQLQLEAIQKRYPDDDPRHIALQKAHDAVFAAELVYVPYLDKRYEAV